MEDEGRNSKRKRTAEQRNMKEMYTYKNQKKLRWGYTTGTCAAAASLAAAVMLLEKKTVRQASLVTPKGIALDLDIEDITRKAEEVSCAVRKDAGDDPDATDGLLIYSTVRKENVFDKKEDSSYEYCCKEYGFLLRLTGGEGVGRVTKEGLSCEVGKAAINPVPRKMIFEQVAKVCKETGFHGTLCIEIHIPKGRQTAERTFNEKLGILGGLSILGTSGMVEPMSEESLLATIRLELRQKRLAGKTQVILTPGNYGEAFLRDHLNIDLNQAVKCSNFIGDTMDMAIEEGIEEALFVGHGGKLIKLAAGVMNTHSSVADGRMEVLAAYATVCGADRDCVEKILEAITVDSALELLEAQEGLRERVMERVMKQVKRHLDARAGKSLHVECIIFTNERGILGKTQGADRLLAKFTSSQVQNADFLET